MATFNQVHEWMSQGNLVIMAAIASVLLVLGIVIERRRKLVWHGNAMFVVMAIAAVMTVSHMGPSFVRVIFETVSDFNLVALLGVVHGAVGLVTLLVGIWFVNVWAIGRSGDTRYCAPKRKLMWRILAMWILALGLGIAYYPLHLLLT
jgi:hypothetical protein